MYHQSLPVKRETVSDLWQQVQDTDFESALCLDMQNLMHKLAGSSGMYGYAAIAEQAREIEQKLMNGIASTDDRETVGVQITDFIRTLDSNFADGPDRENR